MTQFLETHSMHDVKNLPTRWPLRRMYTLGHLKKQIVGERWDSFTLLSLTLQGVIPRDLENRMGKMPASFDTYQIVEPGDLIFCLFDVEETPRTVGLATQKGIVTGAYTVMTPSRDVSPRFLYYRYLSFDQEKSLRYLYAGLRNTIRIQDFKNLRLAIPPLSVQRDIADFLDRETAEIDAFIADQERLIELLEERRAATITHAVTKGLDPTVPMKDSGIEGLGDIPEHWVSGPVKRFFVSLDSRRIPLSSEERSYRQGPFPYYGASGIIDMIDDFLFDEPLVLVSEDGANLNLRSTPIAFVARGKYWVNNHAHILRPRNEAVYFWAERLEALDISPWTTGAAQPKLTAEALMNLKIAVPSSFAECLDIQEHILQEASEIDAAVCDARAAIALSKERRAALISAAVTGQLDVSQHDQPVVEARVDEVWV